MTYTEISYFCVEVPGNNDRNFNTVLSEISHQVAKFQTAIGHKLLCRSAKIIMKMIIMRGSVGIAPPDVINIGMLCILWYKNLVELQL